MLNRLSLFSPKLEGGFYGFGKARFVWWIERVCDDIERHTPYRDREKAVKNCKRVRSLIGVWPRLKRRLMSGKITDLVISVSHFGDVQIWLEFNASSDDYKKAVRDVKKWSEEGVADLLWVEIQREYGRVC